MRNAESRYITYCKRRFDNRSRDANRRLTGHANTSDGWDATEHFRVHSRRGLPVAAAPSLLLDSPASSDDPTLGDSMDFDFYGHFLKMARSFDRENQATQYIDDLITDSAVSPLRRTYASLFRTTRADEAWQQIERLTAQLDRPDVRAGVLESTSLIHEFHMSATFDRVVEDSLFAKCTKTIWLFALAARLLSRLTTQRKSVLPASLLSSWLFDRYLGGPSIVSGNGNLATLSRLALSKCEVVVACSYKAGL